MSSSTRTERNADAALILRKPLSVARFDRAGLTVTVTCSGVVPLLGVTFSQPLSEKAETVTLVGPVDEFIVRVCDGGVTPVCAVNVN